jgi:hypothetical protein
MQFARRMGLEHHAAMNMSQKAETIAEAPGNYLGLDIHPHK